MPETVGVPVMGVPSGCISMSQRVAPSFSVQSNVAPVVVGLVASRLVGAKQLRTGGMFDWKKALNRSAANGSKLDNFTEDDFC